MANDSAGAEKEKKGRHRSANFPSISLDRSIMIVRTLYEKYRRGSVVFGVAMKALNISPTSSGALRVVAALLAYRLVEVDGTGDARQIKVSDLAFRIIADKRDVSPERDMSIRESALSPPMFKKIWEEHPEHLPPDDLLEYELTFVHKFNPGTSKDFINTFKKTMDYASVYNSDIMGDENHFVEDSPMTTTRVGIQDLAALDQQRASMPSYPRKLSAEHEIANYRIMDGTIRLTATGTVNQEAIRKLIKHLELSYDINSKEGPSPTKDEQHDES